VSPPPPSFFCPQRSGEEHFEKRGTDAEIRNLVSGLGVFVLGSVLGSDCGGSMDRGSWILDYGG
jgi:hypothetical protein